MCGAGKYSTGTATACNDVNSGYFSTGGGTSATPTASYSGNGSNGCLSGYKCGACPYGFSSAGGFCYSGYGSHSTYACTANTQISFTFSGCKPGFYYTNCPNGAGTPMDEVYSDDCIACPTGYTCPGDFACATANSYSISYDLAGGTAGTSAPTSTTYDSTFTVSNPTRSGYTFAGWNITGMDGVTHTYGSNTTNSTSISGTTATTFKNLRSTSGTVTFTATWTGNSNTITLNANGATGGKIRNTAVSSGSQTVTFTCTSGSGMTLPTWNSTDSASTTSIYNGKKRFLGWSTSSNATSAGSYTTCPTANTTYYAVWSADCTCGTDTNATCAVQNTSGNTCQYKHTCTTGYWNANNTNTVTSSTMTCTACAAGYFCPANAQSQTRCAAGSYTSATGQSTCTACQNGTTNTGADATSQQSCGTACSNATNTRTDNNSLTWETATWTNNSVTNACTLKNTGCAGNYYYNSNGCTVCPNVTTYKRTTFPENYYATAIESSSMANTAGQTAITGCMALSWITGPRGRLYEYVKYNTTTNKYDNTVGYAWSDANAGYYLTNRAGCGSYAYYGTAEVCPENSYCPGKARVVCDSSNQLTVHTTNFGLESCPTGYSNSAAQSDEITDCYSGTKSRAWTGSQTACAKPSNCATVSCSSCSNSACDYVAYSNSTGDGDGTIKSGCETNNAACQQTVASVTANAGYYVNGTACSACGGNNYYCAGGTAARKTVDSGYYSTGGDANTRTGESACEAGYYCTSGVRSVCAGGKYSTGGATSCSDVTAGYYSSGGGKVAAPTSSSDCLSGYSCGSCSSANGANGRPQYSDAGASSCTECPAVSSALSGRLISYAYYPDSVHAGIRGCYANFTDSDNSATFRTLCYYNSTDGGYGGSNSLCQMYPPTACVAGKYDTIRSTTEWESGGDGVATTHGIDAMNGKVCTDTTAGYYSPADALDQTACATGSYSSAGSATCTACPAGKTTSDAGTAFNTNANTTCSMNCSAIANLSTWNSQTWNSSNNTVTNLCTVNQCVAGAYKSGNTCPVCDTNKYSDAGAASCTACGTANGYGNSGTAASAHAGVASCKVTCGPGQSVETAGNACANVGAGNWCAGGTVAQNATLKKTACGTGLTTIGYGTGADEVGDCGHKFHAGDAVLYLRSTKKTTPSLNVKINGTTFYGNMSLVQHNMSDGTTRKLRVKNDDGAYYVFDDSVDGGGVELPSNFKQLEYIQKPNGSYIDSGIKYKSENIKEEIIASFTSPSGGMFGAQNQPTTKSAGLIYGNILYIGSIYDSTTLFSTQKSNVTIIANNGLYDILKNGTIVKTGSYTGSVQSDYTWWVGGMNTGQTTSATSVGNIYSVKLWDDGDLVFNGVPVRRVSDGAIGMYDTVTGTFKTNAGSGTFTAGPDF